MLYCSESCFFVVDDDAVTLLWVVISHRYTNDWVILPVLSVCIILAGMYAPITLAICQSKYSTSLTAREFSFIRPQTVCDNLYILSTRQYVLGKRHGCLEMLLFGQSATNLLLLQERKDDQKKSLWLLQDLQSAISTCRKLYMYSTKWPGERTDAFNSTYCLW